MTPRPRPRLLLVPAFTELEWAIKPLLEEWSEVATFDMPGVGSRPPPEGIEDEPGRVSGLLPRWRAAAVGTGVRLVEERGWGEFFLVTDGLGAPTAVAIAEARPGSVLGLAIGHAGLSHATQGPRAPTNPAIWEALAQLARQGSEQFVRYGIAQATQGGITEQVAEQMIERFPDMELVSATLEALAREPEPIGDDLEALGLPMLFGKHEGCLGRTDEGFEDVVAAFPQAETVICAEACSASPRFAQAVRDFCEARVSDGSSDT